MDDPLLPVAASIMSRPGGYFKPAGRRLTVLRGGGGRRSVSGNVDSRCAAVLCMGSGWGPETAGDPMGGGVTHGCSRCAAGEGV